MMKSSDYREGGYDGGLLDSLGLVLDFRRSRNRDKSAGSFPEERLEIESKSSERKNVLSRREFFCAPGFQFEKSGRHFLVKVNKKRLRTK